MHAGRIAEADSLATNIGKLINSKNSSNLTHINKQTSSKDLWASVASLTKRKKNLSRPVGLTANSLNDYYGGISSDSKYVAPEVKSTAPVNVSMVSE